MMIKNRFSANGGKGISGDLIMPGDKSISHRAVMSGSLANGITRVSNCLMGDDVMATIKAFQKMGVDFQFESLNTFKITGLGGKVKQQDMALDFGNSGTSIRLMAGILSGLNIRAKLDGDASLRSRPMERIAAPLRMMGADLNLREKDFPPIGICVSGGLHSIDYTLPVASAQVKSAILFAGLFADGITVVREKTPTRDHTERMLERFGAEIFRDDGRIGVRGKGVLRAVDLEIPGDISSAAFFIVGAVISAVGGVRINGVGLNPTRDGVIKILRQMGARIEIENERLIGNEPVADILAYPSSLKGIVIDPALISSAIDEFPVIFVAAACAHGKTILRGAGELRYKESDRLRVMATGLTAVGITVHLFEDGLDIEGGEISGGEINANGDHRVGMAFAMASLRAETTIIINDAAQISTSFPDFFKVSEIAGLSLA